MINVDQHSDQEILNNVQQSLEKIEQKLDAELLSKQKVIDRQEQDIQRLYKALEDKNKLVEDGREKLERCAKESEGSRQLINKLLNDMERLQHDIDWYKRTYEKRSLLGTLKEKLKRG